MEPTAEQFKAMLNAAQMKAESVHGKDKPMTDDEAVKFKRAFDDPEFRKMFAEYVDEMSDPKHRAETELYISQLEGEQKVPQGKELIRPTASFVAKTHKFQIENPGSKGDKIWLNIVQSNKIAEPSNTITANGESWSLPYSLGPPHMEKDSKDSNVAAFDCCFHPRAITLAGQRKQFRDLLVQTAIEGVESGFKKQNLNTKLSSEFHILKGVTYKSGQIPAMMVDLSSKKRWDGESAAPSSAELPASGAAALPTRSSATTSSAPAATSAVPLEQKSAQVPAVEKSPAIKKGFLNKISSSSKTDSKDTNGPRLITELPPAPPSSSPSSSSATDPKAPPLDKKSNVSAISELGGPIEPSYTVKERGSVSWGDFEQMRNNSARPQSTRPAELIVRIEIPKVTVMADMILDVSERQLVLTYKTDYLLSLPLPYPVMDKKGVAKYDKASKCLTVSLPVQPPTAPAASEQPASSSPSSPTLKESPKTNKSESKAASAKSPSTTPSKQAENSSKAASPPKKDSHQRWVSDSSEEERSKAKILKDEINRQAEEARLQALAAPPPSTRSVPETDTAALTSTPAVVVGEAFVRSESFAGGRDGYVFKRGDSGVGYYEDRKPKVVKNDDVHATALTSKSESTSVAKTMAKNASEFSFEYRQTVPAVAVLIQVPAIDPTSVHVKFHSRLVQVFFEAGEGASPYALDLVPAHELKAKSCKFDVVQRNMCLVLSKQVETIWDEEASKLVTSKAYSGEATSAAKSSAANSSLTALQKSVEAMNFNSSSDLLFELD